MSNPHVPIDELRQAERAFARDLGLDPLYTVELDQAYAAGLEDGRASVRRDRLPVLAAIAATLALLVVAFAVGRLTT